MPFVLGPLLIGLLPFLAAIVLLGLSQASTAQHGSSSSGTFWDVITGRFYARKVGGWAADFARWIASHFAAGQLRVLQRWFESQGTLTGGLFSAWAAYAEAVAGALGRIEHRGDPKARQKAAKAAGAAGAAAATAHHALHRSHQVGADLHNYKAHTTPKVNAAHKATTVTIPHDLARIRARNKALERKQTKDESRIKALEDGAIETFKWLRAHPLSAATGVFAGAVAIALGRIGLGNLRCNNFKGLLRKYGCGLGTLLDGLLSLAVSGLVLESVCQFLGLLESAFGALIGPIVHLLNEVPLGACEQMPKSWARLAVAAGPLPPAQTLGQLPPLD